MRKVLLAVALVAVAGCGSKKSNNNNAPAPAPQPAPNPPPNLIDDATAQTLLTTYCAPCHAGPQGQQAYNGKAAGLAVVLDTTATAKSNAAIVADVIKELTVTDDGTKEDMPPTDATPPAKIPSEEDRATLVKWFQQ